MTPIRIQLSRKKGWRMPLNTVKVDRTTPLGNPFIVGKHGTLDECLKYFKFLCYYQIMKLDVDEECIKRQKKFLFHFSKENLRGWNLGCWCKTDKCHAQIMLDFCNAPSQTTR